MEIPNEKKTQLEVQTKQSQQMCSTKSRGILNELGNKTRGQPTPFKFNVVVDKIIKQMKEKYEQLNSTQ